MSILRAIQPLASITTWSEIWIHHISLIMKIQNAIYHWWVCCNTQMQSMVRAYGSQCKMNWLCGWLRHHIVGCHCFIGLRISSSSSQSSSASSKWHKFIAVLRSNHVSDWLWFAYLCANWRNHIQQCNQKPLWKHIENIANLSIFFQI